MEEIINKIKDPKFQFIYKESKKHGNLFVLYYDEEEMGELYIVDEGSLHTYVEFLTEEEQKVEPTYHTQAYIPGPNGGDHDWCYHITQNTMTSGKKTPRNWHKKFTSRNHILPTLQSMIRVANGEHHNDEYSDAGNNVLSVLVDYMKQKGVVFSEDHSTLNIENAYAIMGGNSSIRYFRDTKDGVNGYVVFCYKDGVDLARLCASLEKEGYETGDIKRPFKVQIGKNEIDKAIELLKMNPLNTQGERTIDTDDDVQNDVVTKWLISANKRFDTVRAFNELRTLDWNQGVYKLKEGDIVYIYLGLPIQKVRVKCKVVQANMDASEIDDRKYITGITEEDLEEPFEESNENTMRLTILEEFVDSDLFGAKALEEHGILGQIRTPRTLKDEALAYFEEIDVKENILKQFNDNEVIVNKDVLEKEENILDDDQVEDEEILGSEREVIAKARVNQSNFRKKLISRYGKCALCGMDMKDLLLASHIKPWSESTEKEKTSVENGLLLCPNHDRLFDKGYIAFENDGSILISSLIAKDNYDLLGINEKMRIELTEKNIPFIEYHRKNKHIW